MISKSKLPKISTLLWIFWPVFFALLTHVWMGEFMIKILEQYLIYPPSINHVVNFWLKGGPMWKRIYVGAWFFNSIFIALVYARWLKNNAWHLDDMDKEASLAKALLFGVVAIAASWFVYSTLIFNPGKALSGKTDFLINSDLGLMFAMPLFFLGAACAPVGSASYFFIAGRKIARIFNRESK